MHVTDGRAGLPCDERAKPRRVEDASLAEDAFLRKARRRLRDVTHRVQGVGEDDYDRVRRVPDRLLGDRPYDPFVRRHEIVAAHPGLAGNACGDDHDVRAGGRVVAVRSRDGWLIPEYGRRLVEVEGDALREVLDDVDEDDVRVVAPRELLGDRASRQPGADDRDLVSHAFSPRRFCAQGRNPLVRTPPAARFPMAAASRPRRLPTIRQPLDDRVGIF